MMQESSNFEIFPWNENFKTGVEIIDQQHRQLVDILNRLAKQFVSGSFNQGDMVKILGELSDYAAYHFDTEEKIWRRHFSGHPMLSAHERAHHDFFEKVRQISENRGQVEEFIDDLFGFLTRWLAFHILDNDRRMAIATLAADSGQSLTQALEQADRTMAGSLSVVIQAVLDMYSELSANTIELIKERMTRQRIEEELKETQHALAEQELAASEQRYQILFDAIPDAVLVVDTKTQTLVDCNVEAERLTGRKRKELLGLSALELHPAEERSTHQDHLDSLVTGAGCDHIDATLLQKDGGTREVEISVRGPFLRDQKPCLVGVFRDVTLLRQHHRELEYIAYHDKLTGLWNRNGIKRFLEQLLAGDGCSSEPLLLLHLDVDKFTEVNEILGVELADRALQEFASRLRHVLPPGTQICRIGGDEFFAAIPQWKAEQNIDQFVENLLDQLGEPLHTNDNTLTLTASVGINLCSNLAGLNTETMIRQAAYALYQAKLRGLGHHTLFDASQEERIRRRNALIADVRRGLESDEFELYYQPKVHLPSGDLIGLEALIRWHHPEQGLLNPGAFMPVVERDAIALEIGDWVAESVLQLLDSSRTSKRPTPISINLTALELQTNDLGQKWQVRLREFPLLDPAWIQIEVLESNTMEDMDTALSNLEFLRELGMTIAIDDFGTGQSSLAYLKKLPVDCLKLDQSFVRDMGDSPDDRAIVEAVVNISRAYGLQLLAEGVETETQGRLLLDLGCEYAQGYCIARPMPAPDLEGWQKQWRVPPSWRQ